MTIRVDWERTRGILIAKLHGGIDDGNAEAFRNALDSGISPQVNALILDFEQVPFFSRAGLRALFLTARRFSEPGKQFGVCALSEPARETLTVSGFDRIIPAYETLLEAVAALESE